MGDTEHQTVNHPHGQRERWAPVEGFPGYYVSDSGRVRHGDRLLKPFVYRKKLHIALNYPRRQAVPVAKLVAVAFVPAAKALAGRHMRLFHKNGDPSDCRAENLRVRTKRRYPTVAVQRAMELIDDGVPAKVASAFTGVSVLALKREKRRRIKTTGRRSP